MPAGQLELAGEEGEIERREIDGRREHLPPDALALDCAGQRKLHHIAQPAGERLVEILAPVGGEDREAVEPLHALQQVADLDVGEAVVRVLDLGALAEQRVRLVEEQDASLASAASKIRARFFSVSPMYLLTTCERSMR